MKSIRKPRPSYIIVAASAVQLSLTGCHSEEKSNLEPFHTVNPAPILKPEELEKSCKENYNPAICPTVNPPPMADPAKEGSIYQFDFDTISMELVGGLTPNMSGEVQDFTIKKDALNPKQTEILKSLYEITDLTQLSCAPDVDGVAYKMVLYKNQTTIHNIMSSDGYCSESKGLRDVTFVEATALRDFYLSKP